MRPTLLPLLLPLLLAAAPTPAPAPPTEFVILSDFNGPYGRTTYPTALRRTVALLTRAPRPALVLSAGDLIAGQKASQSDEQVRAMWAGFDREVREPLRRAGIPFLFTLGNHDASPSLPRDRREAARFWQAHLPPVPLLDHAHYPHRYTFAFQGVFVAILDASGPDVNGTQREWLSTQLATPAARAAGVRLVVGHLPLSGVSAEKNRPGEVITAATPLRDVMERGGVLAYISGHHAAYYPGRLDNLNVLASGGIGGRDYIGHPGTARSTYTRLTLYPDEHRATFRTFDADTGQEIPTATLPMQIEGLGGTLRRVDEFR